MAPRRPLTFPTENFFSLSYNASPSGTRKRCEFFLQEILLTFFFLQKLSFTLLSSLPFPIDYHIFVSFPWIIPSALPGSRSPDIPDNKSWKFRPSLFVNVFINVKIRFTTSPILRNWPMASAFKAKDFIFEKDYSRHVNGIKRTNRDNRASSNGLQIGDLLKITLKTCYPLRSLKAERKS